MRIRMMWIRCITALVLFLLLAKVNVWADTTTHLTLAAGYRAFLLATPGFLLFGLSIGMRAALGFCFVAAVGAIFSVNVLTMGALAVGMAVSGYIAKFVAAHTSTGAADNKVSLNVGSLGSGLLLMTVVDRETLLYLAAALLLIAWALSWKVDWDRHTDVLSAVSSGTPALRSREFLKISGWGLIGIATGIKLTGMFAILPQYLIVRLGGLPQWFGLLIIVNSLLVILLQHQILKVLDRLAPRFTFLTSLSALILLMLPSVLRVEMLPSAFFWILLLTLGECALSHYDRTARDAGYLFPKELMVGVGSFVTVWLSRSYPEQIHWSGFLGTCCMLLGAFIVLPEVFGVSTQWAFPVTEAPR